MVFVLIKNKLVKYDVIPAKYKQFEVIKIPFTKNDWEWLRESNEIISPEAVI